jgi:hypothetical protein
MSSIDVWLKRGKKVEIGGRDLYMMPLPLSKLIGVGTWLEESSNDVVSETLKNVEPGKVPNVMVLVAKVLNKVNVSQVAFEIFSLPKDPETRESVNKNLSKEFFDEYLDIPTANILVKTFVELNDIPEIIKNLQSLPVVKRLSEAASLTFGIPFLNSLLQNTVSTQTKPEGSLFPKSTDSAERTDIVEQVLGSNPPTELRVQ